jgi:hypothetical protein
MMTGTSPDIQHRKGMAICQAASAYLAVPTSFNKIRVTRSRAILDVA